MLGGGGQHIKNKTFNAQRLHKLDAVISQGKMVLVREKSLFVFRNGRWTSPFVNFQ